MVIREVKPVKFSCNANNTQVYAELDSGNFCRNSNSSMENKLLAFL